MRFVHHQVIMERLLIWSLDNINLVAKTGYQISKFSIIYAFGAYKNLKTNTRIIIESGSEEVYNEDNFQLAHDNINFKSIGLISSIEVGYKVTKYTELRLHSGAIFVEGLKSNKGSENNNLLTNFGFGIRRYLF